ncbi:MAG TPA: hypothetical protein VMS32_10285 [Verrucomicrobiae bacterium]|jgi:hypothetical protein|nr:hypothetical protein [Verrucomicrobiae bacterium]
MLLGALALLAMSGQQPCWSIYDSALTHRVTEAQPAYVTYDERIALTDDDFPILNSVAQIAYRSDGLARVDDLRFSGFSYVTNHVEPGPPLLGPYGDQRDAWLPSADPPFPIIENVHSHGGATCSNLGIEQYHGHTTYHLQLTASDPNRPSVKALWIDTGSQEVWKVIASGRLLFVAAQTNVRPLADFEVELAQEGPYVVVNHVTWSYNLRVYSQYENFFGEYYMSDFAYPNRVAENEFAVHVH